MRPNDPRFKGMRAKKVSTGKVSEGRLAWIRFNMLSLVLYRKPDSFFDNLPEGSEQAEEYKVHSEGDGDHINLAISIASSKVAIALTSYTAQELRSMKNFIDFAIDEALPIAEARDKASMEVLEDYDDDSNTRVYRDIPELFIRKGHVGEYNSRLLDRFAGDDAVVRRPGAARGLTESVGTVADEEPKHGISQDDKPTLNLPSIVREVGQD